MPEDFSLSKGAEFVPNALPDVNFEEIDLYIIQKPNSNNNLLSFIDLNLLC